MFTGPQPYTHEERIQRALEIDRQLKEHFGDLLVAVGIYGSVAISRDGPYSDLEMLCIVQGKGVEDTLEWINGAPDAAGKWKVEINLFSPDTFLKYAETLDENWPITHGMLLNVLPLRDPTHFFWGVQTVVLGHPAEAFEAQVRAIIVGNIYELVGKIRNAQAAGRSENLAMYMVFLARTCACLVALAHRKPYSSASAMFRESLLLDDRPAGYDVFFRLVMDEAPATPPEIFSATETLWNGVEAWAAARGIQFQSTLDEQLKNYEHSPR